MNSSAPGNCKLITDSDWSTDQEPPGHEWQFMVRQRSHLERPDRPSDLVSLLIGLGPFAAAPYFLLRVADLDDLEPQEMAELAVVLGPLSAAPLPASGSGPTAPDQAATGPARPHCPTRQEVRPGSGSAHPTVGVPAARPYRYQQAYQFQRPSGTRLARPGTPADSVGPLSADFGPRARS